MENASQALIMAGSVLIALLVISLGMYLVKSASTVGENYERVNSQIESQKFNDNFERYLKKPRYIKHVQHIDDRTGEIVVDVHDIRDNTTDTSYVFYDYNTIADVVSATNKAYSINNEHHNDSQASVDIYIEITEGSSAGKYGIIPNANVQKGFVYPGAKINTNTQRISVTIDKNKAKSLNQFLSEYSESKLVGSDGLRLYKYGFEGITHINDETGLIDSVQFIMRKNQIYDLVS